MTTNYPQILRKIAERRRKIGAHFGVLDADSLMGAADEIERLQRIQERLWDALLWLDTFSPEDTAAMEDKFGLDLKTSTLQEPKP